MKPRLIPYAVAPATMKAFIDFSTALAEKGTDHRLAHLVKIRASQINCCSFCLHMHSREALSDGESELRVTMLAAWRESPLYSERERAALAWTEALTRLSETGAPDEVYTEMAAHFSPEEQVELTMTIAVINAWNRFGVGFHAVHATPKPDKVAA